MTIDWSHRWGKFRHVTSMDAAMKVKIGIGRKRESRFPGLLYADDLVLDLECFRRIRYRKVASKRKVAGGIWSLVNGKDLQLECAYLFLCMAMRTML